MLEQHHPRLNVLINNASVQYNYQFDTEPDALCKVDYEIRINLIAPTKLIALLTANQDPAIVNMSSALGFVPKASAPVYDATKAGIHIFTQALRYQLPGVRVMEVIPPLVDTPMTAGRAVRQWQDFAGRAG
ncbi:SDR family NAD(P)-dependent oxidoreductase [Spirosoma arcticum]